MMMPALGVKNGGSKFRLYTFIYGSLGVLLLCLFVGAYVFSSTYLMKEQARAEDSADVIGKYFDAQYQNMIQEMSDQMYEAIHVRVKEIAKRLGSADYQLILLDKSGKCVLEKKSATSSECAIPEDFSIQIPKFKPTERDVALSYDYHSNHYKYITAIYAGPILVGYLYASLSDPYNFNRENTLLLVMKVFSIPIAGIVIAWLIWLFIAHRWILKPYLKDILALEKKRAVADLAGKVAHNIRSPLVVLDSVLKSLRGSSHLGESQRKLLISVSNRIETIANDLMTHFIQKETNPEAGNYCFLWPVIEAISAEKSVVLGKQSKLEIRSSISPELYSSCIPISVAEFSSVLSNLLNNSIYAIQKTKLDRPGIISIQIERDEEQSGFCSVTVADNGNGIPTEILQKLRAIGGTYGKEGGAGLGLQHARTLLAGLRGSLSIESVQGEGTTIRLSIPLISPPKWLATHIDLREAKKVVVLEDDPGMVLLWKQRLGEGKSFEAFYFNQPEQFNVSLFPFEQCSYIFDYELEGSSITGLDLIIQYGLKERAILVTSYFTDPQIQKQVEAAGSKMLPKFMAPKAELLLPENVAPRKVGYDLVLIDDDLMVHELWNFAAGSCGKIVKAVQKLAELDLGELRKDIPIFIDVNLGDAVSGIEVAKDLFDFGFTHLSLTTGEQIDKIFVPPFIREVRSKEFPI